MPVPRILRIALILFLLGRTADMAAQSVMPDRPDETESPYAIDAGSIQLEMGADHELESAGYGADLMIRSGLKGNREVRVQLSAIDEIELSLKQQFIEKEALNAGIIVLLGSAGVPIGKLIVPIEVKAGPYSVGINSIHEMDVLDRRSVEWTFTHSHAIELSSSISLFGELLHRGSSGLDIGMINAGGYYQIGDLLALDVMFSLDLEEEEKRIGAGFSWLFRRSE